MVKFHHTGTVVQYRDHCTCIQGRTPRPHMYRLRIAPTDPASRFPARPAYVASGLTYATRPKVGGEVQGHTSETAGGGIFLLPIKQQFHATYHGFWQFKLGPYRPGHGPECSGHVPSGVHPTSITAYHPRLVAATGGGKRYFYIKYENILTPWSNQVNPHLWST